MSRLPKIPVSNSSSNLPAPRRRSSVGNQGKPNLSLLTPEQEVLLAQVMERYGSRSNNSNEHHNASSTSPPLTTTTSSSISPPPVSSNQQQQNTTTLRKPGARRQSVSRNTRPTLPPLAELPTSNNTTTSIAPPKQSASKILSPPSSNNNSSSLATPNQPRRSPSNQNLQSGGGLKPSPAQQRLRVASTPQRPESPSLSLYSVGERVSVESMNIIGTLKYLGPLDIKPGTWAGIELDLPGTGKNDGNVNGKSYFTCKPKSGIFVLASKLSKETSSDQDSSDQSLPPPQRQKQKLPSSAKSLQRPSQIGLNNTATPSDNIQSSSNMTKNAQNAAIAASRITAGSRASKYIEITQSSTTSNDSPYSKSKQSILKRPGSIGNLKSNSSIQSSSISSPSSNNNALPNTRRRSNSSSSSGSAVSNKSQPTSSYHYSSRISANNKHRSPSPNHATDSQTTSDTESLGHATNNEEMSNKILQEKIQKLLNDQDTSESAHHINSNQTDVSMTANKENKEKWEAEKKVLLDEKENREKTLNRKIEDLNKQLQDSAKGHHFRPSTSLSMIADDDVMSDKILQLTELVEQKDEQVKELEDALGKANKQSDEYQSKIQHLEKINSEQTDKIEQLLVQISPNAQSELTDKIEQLEKTIQTEENETSEEEDIDNIMNRPRKVFKPTKKSDKKIIPTNQILVNKSSDTSNEEPLAVLMDENINPNHYVRGGNNNNFNFNNFNPHSRPTSPNQFRPLSYLSHGHLSAREQELLARETGSPLINLPEKPKGPQTGLIGAIAAIEVRRRSQGQGVLARQAEAEREREREHRLMEQRQQLLIAERDHSLYNRPGGPGNGGGGSDFRSRFISNQPHYDLAPINSQRNFYNEEDYFYHYY
ncbi:2359_t:CDS:2 [Entrophospora sp. SA101]|nr:2359_t:CDS:2 [Entrophospora sp. SA101]